MEETTPEVVAEPAPEVAPEVKEGEVEAPDQQDEGAAKAEDFRKRSELFVAEMNVLQKKYDIGLNIMTQDQKQ